jgi:hypothetical protein
MLLEKKILLRSNTENNTQKKCVKISDVQHNLNTFLENFCFQGYALHILTCLHGVITMAPLYDKEDNQIFENIR